MSRSGRPADALPSLLAGTSRVPLPPHLRDAAHADASLRALSLAGQASRFELPCVPEHFAVEQTVDDRRRMMPQPLRRALLRIVTGKPATEHPALAIAQTLDRLHLRPHPFDLPKLDSFVRQHAERLGTTAQHWARRKSDAPEEDLGYFDQDVLDDLQWKEATTGRRVEFLVGRRREDPAAARALLEATWPQEPAEVRWKLLQAFVVGLGKADEEFLRSLERDRAPRVRVLAQRLLAKLGASGENAALVALLERIKRKETGLLRKRTSLALELPLTVTEHMAASWIREAFADVTVEEFAKALAMGEDGLVEASAKDENLLLGLAWMATVDGRLELLRRVVEHLPQAWQRMAASGSVPEFGVMGVAERLQWAEILISADGSTLPWDYAALHWLSLAMEGAAPAKLLDRAFRSGWFDEPANAARHTPHLMEVTAALCPAAQRQRLREGLANFDATVTTMSLALLDLLDALERDHDHA